MNSAKKWISDLLEGAGVHIDGLQPWDIQVHDDRLYQRVIRHGSLGMGEAYMDGWWDCSALEDFFHRILRAGLEKKVRYNLTAYREAAKAILFNQQSRNKSLRVAKLHYDAGNDLFRLMLDKRMIYSCAWWDHAQTLDEAQEQKLDLICRKLKLEPGQTLLDIGCGWGGLARYAAEKFGVSVVGITLSREQASVASEICKGLPVDIQIRDYRLMVGKFDRIVSVGMFEHVGHKNYPTYMNKARELLYEDGLFLVQSIGCTEPSLYTDKWLDKYIFPGSMIPSPQQITDAIRGRFILQDWHNLGPNYYLTLMAWLKNFEKGWPSLSEKYGPRFYRMWKYYLCISAATFSSRKNHLWQIVLSYPSRMTPYSSVR